ncbi:MAG: YidC/Oxa1 family membrane protein insertase [Bacilli bacterium]|nr:YidC/Oxa1 family membrane protein insertase [Clostridium sp.]MDY3798712.1 YidC/Oxa1 family membrane protein insertase [Bacilli bacterium]
MKNKKIIMIILCIFMLTGCTKILKDSEKKVVKNPETGQAITENIICKPTEKDATKIYEDNNVDISKLPECNKFTPLKNYEGLWTSLFVKPLAWLIIKIESLVKNSGLAIIISCLLIRLVLYPLTRKTAMQSELIKKASPELEKLEKKYKDKTSTEDQQRKAQEMMLIYQKYQINPISGCLLSFLQIPLVMAYYEAINRTPIIFEGNFLSLNLGTTPWTAITHGKYIYIILIVLIFLTTLVSFKKTLKDQSAQAQNMKFSLYFMLAIITYASFTMSSALGIYWVTSSLFTIIQNLLVERKKVEK